MDTSMKFAKDTVVIMNSFVAFAKAYGGDYRSELNDVVSYFSKVVDDLKTKDEIRVRKLWFAFAAAYKVWFCNNGGAMLFNWIKDKVVESDYELVGEFNTVDDLANTYKHCLEVIGTGKGFGWIDDHVEYCMNGIRIDGKRLEDYGKIDIGEIVDNF